MKTILVVYTKRVLTFIAFLCTFNTCFAQSDTSYFERSRATPLALQSIDFEISKSCQEDFIENVKYSYFVAKSPFRYVVTQHFKRLGYNKQYTDAFISKILSSHNVFYEVVRAIWLDDDSKTDWSLYAYFRSLHVKGATARQLINYCDKYMKPIK